MLTTTNTLLTNVDRMSRRMAPVDALLGRLTERLGLQTTAKACAAGGGYTILCDSYCEPSDYCCARNHQQKYSEYARTHIGCDFGDVRTCSEGCLCGGACF